MSKRTRTSHYKRMLRMGMAISKRIRAIYDHEAKVSSIVQAQVRNVIGSALGVPSHLPKEVSVDPVKLEEK